MSFPNPAHFTDATPQWRPVAGKPGVYLHDDAPGCEVEVIAYVCPRCGEQRTTMHAVHACKDGHRPAGATERKLHATCRCGATLLRQLGVDTNAAGTQNVPS